MVGLFWSTMPAAWGYPAAVGNLVDRVWMRGVVPAVVLVFGGVRESIRLCSVVWFDTVP